MTQLYAWQMHRMTREEWSSLDVEVRVPLVVSLFRGWTYTGREPRVPFLPHDRRAFPESLVDPNRTATNCSTFTAASLIGAFPSASWSRESYGRLQVFDAGKLDSPIAEVERVGVGRRVDEFISGRWHLLQGWKETISPRGHALFVHRGERGLVLAHASSRLNRVGFEPTTEALLDRMFPARRFVAVLEEAL